MLVLNDQGGSVMHVSEDVTATLRAQDHGHPPVVCYESHPSDSRIREAGNVCPTITAKIKKGTADSPLILIRKTFRPGTKFNGEFVETDVASTLDTRYHYGSGGDGVLIVSAGEVNDETCQQKRTER